MSYLRIQDALRGVLGVAVVCALVVSSPAVAVAQDTVITRGAALGSSPTVDLAEAIQSVDAYVDQTVILEGAVKKVCQAKGCWMEVSPKGADRGIRVTFKDYAFFMPTDSQGAEARLEGVFETNLFSKKDADHLIAEGVVLTRHADGTATEVSFVAQGVELRR
jgi:hypothetical protein